MAGSLHKTPLGDWHSTHGGRMVDFAGWSMPVQYSSIVTEHQATRRAAGLFDVSHMGRLRLDGDGAAEFLDRLLTRRVTDLVPGQVRYSLVCNEAGGILDDVLVYRLENHAGKPRFLLVVNASNRQKISDWLDSFLRSWAEVHITDLTHETAMIAVQGPAALRCVGSLCEVDLNTLDYYHAASSKVCGHSATVSRTGYTGEDGCELVVPAGVAAEVWEQVLEKGRAIGAMAVGLGARDTLRLEAGMPLYGHELTETINPYQAKLSFAVNLEGRQFVGCQALAEARQDKAQRVRVGLELAGRRSAREHYAVFAAGGDASSPAVGEVTSGTFSPTLQKAIAMAYVEPDRAVVGTELSIDIRGSREAARVVKLPFYSRK